MAASPAIVRPIDTASDAAASINRIYRTLAYDHRPYLDPHDEAFAAKNTDDYRRRYACFKYAVAKVLRPQTIIEIGVGSGVSALAFLHARPNLRYVGLDIGEWDTRLGKPFLQTMSAKLSALRFDYQIIEGDSQQVNKLPECDLVHIDGNHSSEAVYHDMLSAWASGAKWILCDDACDPAVGAGIFRALQVGLDRGSVDWAYFPDTWAGDILIRTDHRREE
jgi:predicted O-methyltransferase YrrM